MKSGDRNTSSRASSHKGFQGLIAGGITGAAEITITYPMEYLKIQLQLDRNVNKQQPQGIRSIIKSTIKTHGVLGFYRGLSVVIFGAVPKQAVRFAAFEELKRFAVDSKGNLSSSGRVACGLGAGTCEALFAVTPMENMKVKLINDQRRPIPQYRGLFHGIFHIVKEHGLLALYQGVTPTVLKQATNQGIRFYIVETLKHRWREGDPNKPVSKLAVASFGAFAGFVSVIVNTPLDVVKTRMQGLQSARYTSTLNCFVKMTKEEGLTSFYKGVLPRLTRVCFEVAITFTLYDSLMELFKEIGFVG